MTRAVAIALSSLLLLAFGAKADVVALPGGARIDVKVQTLVDLRFKNIVRQGFDVSCGAAALATLFTYYLDRPVKEGDLIASILSTASEEDKKNIGELGFSMLELKRAGDRMGLQTAGFRLESIDRLAQLKVPALTLVDIGGYKHFVVIKGLSADRVFIADPAFGNRSRSWSSFASEWNNVILVFIDPKKPGNNKFVLEGTPMGPADKVYSVLDHSLRHFSTTKMPGEF